MSGDAHWDAIDELRRSHTAHEREFGVINGRLEGVKAEIDEVKVDVNNLGEDIRKTRHDLRNQMTATEGRLSQLIRAETEKVRAEQAKKREDTLTTVRFRLMLAAPIVGVVIAYILARAG